jgi:hypothetical protein
MRLGELICEQMLLIYDLDEVDGLHAGAEFALSSN